MKKRFLMMKTKTMTMTSSFAAALMLLVLPAAAQDVLTIGSATSVTGGSVTLPVSLRDVSGTPLGSDAARIQAIALRLQVSPADAVTTLSYTRAGVAQSLTPLFESTAETSAGNTRSIAYLASFSETSQPIPLVSNASAPGNHIGNLELTLASALPADTQITVTFDRNVTALSNQAGTIVETTFNRHLTFATGGVSVTATPCDAFGITTSPSSVTITRGATTMLAVSATGTSRQYQWYTGPSGDTTAPISGATASSLYVTPPATTSYWVRVSDLCSGASAASSTAVVTVSQYVRGDYTGDGRADALVFRPSTATWHSSNETSFSWGAPNDVPVVADYDGDRIADYATYRPSTGGWLIKQSTTGATMTAVLGGTLDTPAPADYDGDGKADVAVFRQSTGVWTIRESSNGVTTTVQWGGSGGDIPVPADYDGDGKADIAIFSQGTGGGSGLWYIILSHNGGTEVVQWGGSGGDIPIPYDFDGDGRDDIAIESPVDGRWYIIESGSGGTRVEQWGGSGGDQPQPSDFDGDGKADLAIFNPGPGQWYIVTSSNGATVVLNLGQQGDIAVSR